MPHSAGFEPASHSWVSNRIDKGCLHAELAFASAGQRSSSWLQAERGSARSLPVASCALANARFAMDPSVGGADG